MLNKKRAIGIAVLLLFIAAMFMIYTTWKPNPEIGAKTVILEIVHSDQSVRTVEMHTDALYLGQALGEQVGLIKGDSGPYGLFITEADGEAASEAARTWWCITKEGEMVSTGVDLTPIADGDQFALTLQTY